MLHSNLEFDYYLPWKLEIEREKWKREEESWVKNKSNKPNYKKFQEEKEDMNNKFGQHCYTTMKIRVRILKEARNIRKKGWEKKWGWVVHCVHNGR